MGRTANAAVSTTPLLMREDCKSTKHDSAFSQWKILIGPCDWEDYLLNKEGAERYRTHNLPNCSSCSGLYELGIAISLPRLEGKSSSNLNSKCIIPVYLGQADNVRTRLQQYGRDGAHLENGWSNGEPNDLKARGLFSDIFSKGCAIAFRWAPMESKKDAEKTESQLLKTFDYAWNRGMNGERRPSDIHRKLDLDTSSTKRVPLVFKKLHTLGPKKVGLSIKHCDSPMLENGSSFYSKQEGTTILSRIFKFSHSLPTLVSRECDVNNSETRTCGVALRQGSICTRPPVEGRKRCAEHKGMKVNAYVRPSLLGTTEDIRHLTCGVTPDDASLCTRVPVAGRKRCEEHKGMRVKGHVPLPLIVQEKHYIPSFGVDLGIGTSCNRHKSGVLEADRNSVRVTRIIVDRDYHCNTGAITLNGSFGRRKAGEDSKFCWQHEAMRAKINHSSRQSDLYETLLTCGAITHNGSFCRRKAGEDSKFCWQHEAMRAKINHSSRQSDLYETSPYSSTCGAMTKRGTSCKRRTTGGQRCFQH